MDEAEQLLASAESKQKVAPDIPVRCVAPMPPLLALYLRSHARFPKSTVNSAAKANPETLPPTMREANGFLLLTKVFEDPTTLQVPIPPTPEEQARIHPPYSVASEGGLVAKRQVDRDSYFIRRSDSRGIYWKVITTKDPPPISQQLISSSSEVPKP
ncbi:unnamed protein product [Dicrocoelium dendriticum]|nr:unnamed protein product [Dicrocoelium dendriticum]